jgi:pimeloyl-ACP methyl ester carboxylesterase
VNLFCRQLGELLEALGIGSASLVGLSMGGAIAASYAAGQPGVVRRLVLIDPAGAQGVPISRWVRIFRFPVVGDILFGALLGAGLIWAAGSGHLEHSAVAALKKAVSDQLRIRGSRSALLSTARNGMLGDFLDVYGRLHKLHIPVLIVWGREDRIVPIAQSARLRAALPEAEFRPIDGCGHMPHFERPGHVNALLAEFLK